MATTTGPKINPVEWHPMTSADRWTEKNRDAIPSMLRTLKRVEAEIGELVDFGVLDCLPLCGLWNDVHDTIAKVEAQINA